MLKQLIPYMNAERKLNGRLISVMIICSLLIPVILVLSISTYDFYFGMPEAAFITAGVFVIACVFFIIRLFVKCFFFFRFINYRFNFNWSYTNIAIC